jgi:hypothetical protein
VGACVRIATRTFPSIPTFFEPHHLHEDGAAITQAAAGIAEGGGGFKLRCGGPTREAFPTPWWIGVVLHVCREAHLPMKLTAGLHHPLPRIDPSIPAAMHGFINVLLAGVFAGGWREDTVLELLEDTDPAHFDFTSGVRWTCWTASLVEVTATRRSGILSIGSCSFDEPRDDLRAIGWLQENRHEPHD